MRLWCRVVWSVEPDVLVVLFLSRQYGVYPAVVRAQLQGLNERQSSAHLLSFYCCVQDVLPRSSTNSSRPQVDCSIFTACARDEIPRPDYLILVYVLGNPHRRRISTVPTRSRS
jgi:hypothetical protein